MEKKKSGCRSLAKQVKSFFSPGFTGRRLLFEAVCFQYLVWFLMLFLPFRKMFDPADFGKVEEVEVDSDLLDKIKIATARAEKFALWKNRCLVKSLAAYRMLKRRGIKASLHLGFTASRDNKPVAHAWLQVGNFEVVPKGQVDVELFLSAQ